MTRNILASLFCFTLLAGCGTAELAIRTERPRHQPPCYEIVHIRSYQPTLWGKPVGEPRFDITVRGEHVFLNANPRYILHPRYGSP
ncbi:MAG: hypothetical protein HYW88_00495, partial [Candidatus Sungbacteria bacterium]|nr:hypothetical protein [Candidatus Sungbacteria bacterium]